MNEAVLNQPPPFEGINLFSSDQALVEALKREAAPWALEVAAAFGRLAGRLNVSMDTGLMNFRMPNSRRISLAHSYREQYPLFVR